MPCLVEALTLWQFFSFSESCKNINTGVLTPVKQANIIILLLHMGSLQDRAVACSDPRPHSKLLEVPALGFKHSWIPA